MGKTIRAIVKSNLVRQVTDSPETIRKAASLFDDDAAILR